MSAGPQRTTPDALRVMAFDVGLKRTGVAVGNSITQSAQALGTVHAEGNARFDAIAKLISQWEPDALVVGVPRFSDGKAHAMTERCQKFGRQLQGRFGLPVFETDERYTSVEAQIEGAHDLDAASAQLIAEQYLRNAA